MDFHPITGVLADNERTIHNNFQAHLLCLINTITNTKK